MLHYIYFFIIALFIICKAHASSLTDPIIPRKILFGNPEKTNVQLSHDGKYISYEAPKNGVLSLWIADRNNLSDAIAIANDLKGYYWAYDNKHIIFVRDNKGDENYRLYAYNLENNREILLTQKSGSTIGFDMAVPSKPNEILIGLNERDKRYFDLYEINMLDYSRTPILKNNRFKNFMVDNDLNIRFGIELNKDDGSKSYFLLKDDRWIPFMTLTQEDSANTFFEGFNKTNNILYLRDSRGRDTAALKTLDIATGKMTTIASNKHSDVYIATGHPTERNVQMVVTNYDKERYEILDKSIA